MLKVGAIVLVGVIGLGLAEYFILRTVSPIYVDGTGPMPSFYWGHAPAPTLQEWRDSPELQQLFLRPYKIVAAVLALTGGILVPVCTRAFSKTPNAFRSSAVFCLLVLAGMAVAHDAIGRSAVFEGMPIILSQSGLRVFAAATIPAALLSGAIAVALHRVR